MVVSLFLVSRSPVLKRATDKNAFSVHEAGFKNIEEPNSEDVVKTASPQ